MEDNKKSARGFSVRHNVSVRSRALGRIPDILSALGSLRIAERRTALASAARSFDEDTVARPQETGWANMLARTFFSFSYDGFSPERLAWEAVIRGLSVIGCCDRDSLGALDEMQTAADALGIRAVVSMETVARVDSAADREINCPGQPGLARVLGIGFTAPPLPEDEHGRLIASLPERTREYARTMLARLNPLLSPVAVDFENDLLPMTPSGNAGPGHIAATFIGKAEETFPDAADRAVFWADVLGRSPEDVECLWSDRGEFMDVVQEKLLRMAPEESSSAAYPAAADLFRAFEASGAAACILWRGGASGGVADAGKFLDDAVNWGARAAALTPDACWNIADPAEKERGLAALSDFMAAARKRNLPVLAGSFMDGPRQKFVDSLDAPELSPYVRDFADSAFWLYGHAVLQRAIGAGLTSDWAHRHFGPDRAAANAFYAEAGRKAAPGKAARARIAEAGPDARPGDVLAALAPPKI
jgi:hypothetical protein